MPAPAVRFRSRKPLLLCRAAGALTDGGVSQCTVSCERLQQQAGKVQVSVVVDKGNSREHPLLWDAVGLAGRPQLIPRPECRRVESSAMLKQLRAELGQLSTCRVQRLTW